MSLTEINTTTPSIALWQALSDVKAAQRMKKVAINMDEWHEPYDDKCQVCLAGCMMIRRTKKGKSLNNPLEPGEFPSKLRKVFHALNEWRMGDVLQGLKSFHRGTYAGWWYCANILADLGLPRSITVSSYDQDSDGVEFFEDMEKVMDILRQVEAEERRRG